MHCRQHCPCGRCGAPLLPMATACAGTRQRHAAADGTSTSMTWTRGSRSIAEFTNRTPSRKLWPFASWTWPNMWTRGRTRVNACEFVPGHELSADHKQGHPPAHTHQYTQSQHAPTHAPACTHRLQQVVAAPVSILRVHLCARRAWPPGVVSVTDPRQVMCSKRRHVCDEHVRIRGNRGPLAPQVPAAEAHVA